MLAILPTLHFYFSTGVFSATLATKYLSARNKQATSEFSFATARLLVTRSLLAAQEKPIAHLEFLLCGGRPSPIGTLLKSGC
jgi:hypothetical protein